MSGRRAMRPARGVSSKNAPQARRSAEALIRHRRPERPAVQLIGNQLADYPSRSGDRKASPEAHFSARRPRRGGATCFAARSLCRAQKKLPTREPSRVGSRPLFLSWGFPIVRAARRSPSSCSTPSPCCAARRPAESDRAAWRGRSRTWPCGAAGCSCRPSRRRSPC